MNPTSFHKLYTDCTELLVQHRLLDALIKLETLAKYSTQVSATDALHALRQDYTMMLGYMKSGRKDIDRERFYSDFLRKAFRIADLMRRSFVLEHPGDYVTEVWRRLHKVQEDVANVYVPFVEGRDGRPASLQAILDDPLAAYTQLFDTVFTSEVWTRAERQAAYAYVMNDNAPYINRMVLVSAVGVALQFCFDEEKMLFLLSVIEEHQTEVCIRSLVMVCLAVATYRDRLSLYSEITLKLDLLSELPLFHPLVVEVQKALIVASRSPEIAKSMEDEIPAKMEKAHDEMQALKDLDEEDAAEYIDQHPDLKRFRKDLFDSMHEFVKMQLIGVDINYHSFMHIQSVTPFFEEAANWFCPFTFEHPLLYNINEKMKILGLITNLKPCDTDRYAIIFNMGAQFPEIRVVKQDSVTMEETDVEEEEIGEFIGQLAEHVERKQTHRPKSLLDMPEEELRMRVVGCVQDTYRFFSIFKPEDLAAPFGEDLKMWEDPLFCRIFEAEEKRRDLADCYFMLEDHKAAVALYNTVTLDKDAHLRLALAYENLGNVDSAKLHYREAILLDPDDEWTVRHLMASYCLTGELQKAAELLEPIVTREPENNRAARHLAEFYASLNRYSEAMQLYDRLYYLQPDRIDVCRGRAFCLMALGRYDEAMELYMKFLYSDMVESDDFQNVGHCALLLGDTPSAVVFYQECLKLREEGYARPDFFGPDREFLAERGIDATTQQIIIDLLNV